MKRLILLIPLLASCQVTESEKQLLMSAATIECQRIKAPDKQVLCLTAAGVALEQAQAYVNSLPTRKP